MWKRARVYHCFASLQTDTVRSLSIFAGAVGPSGTPCTLNAALSLRCLLPVSQGAGAAGAWGEGGGGGHNEAAVHTTESHGRCNRPHDFSLALTDNGESGIPIQRRARNIHTIATLGVQSKHQSNKTEYQSSAFFRRSRKMKGCVQNGNTGWN